MPEAQTKSKSNSNFDFANYLAVRRRLIEESLALYLADGEPAKLFDAMRYSVLSGGKRLRALLVIAAAESVAAAQENGDEPDQSLLERVMPCACAIEMVHAMSLIHDDLPCLDNDDLRRGKATNHKVFGEAMALLAGDGLLMLANEVLIAQTRNVAPTNLLEVALELSKATGPSGMVGGQVKDMEFTGSADHIDVETVAGIHAGKTGALIRFSLWSGGKLMNAPEKQLRSLYRLGEILGLAFQIQDDLLDVTGDAKTLGKTPGKDEATKKATWVAAIGIDGARSKLAELEAEGKALIESASLDNSRASGSSSPVLHSLLKFSIHREK